MHKRVFAVFALVVFFAVSCMKGGTNPVKRMAEGSEPAFEIKGEVIWKGATPIIYPIPTTAYKGACGKRRSLSVLRLYETRLWLKRLLDVAVWLEPVWEDMAPEDVGRLAVDRGGMPDGPPEVSELGCEFNPRLQIVPVGAVVELVNDDRKDHWTVIEGLHRVREQYVQYYGDTPPVFSFETPGVHYQPRNEPVRFTADKVDIWHLTSGFHRWMEGWVVVTDRKWFEKVDHKGLFEFKGVPRGIYRVHTWHPVLGEASVVVKVPDEARGRISVSYSEIPKAVEDIASTVITTSGEVWDEHSVWHDVEEW